MPSSLRIAPIVCLALTSLAGAGFSFPGHVTSGPEGKLYVTGQTNRRDLPTSANALQARPGNAECEDRQKDFECYDGFIARLSATGELEAATYLGGGGFDSAPELSIGSDGRLQVRIFSSSASLLGQEGGAALLPAYYLELGPDLDQTAYVYSPPGGAPGNYPEFYIDGSLRAVTDDLRLLSLDPRTGLATEIGRIRPPEDSSTFAERLTVSPDGDLYVAWGYYLENDERQLRLSKMSADGQTEHYRRPLDFAIHRAMPDGTAWVSRSSRENGERFGRLAANGDVQFTEALSLIDAVFPGAAGEVWVTGRMFRPLRTTAHAAAHCREKMGQQYWARLRARDLQIEFLALRPASEVWPPWIAPRAEGARVGAWTNDGFALSDFVLTPPPAGPAPFCLDANIDNLAIAEWRRGNPEDGFCRGFCWADTHDPSALAPGQMISIPGRGLGPATLENAPAGPLPRVLAGTRLLLDGKPLALLSVKEDRIDAVLPFDLAVEAKPRFTVEREGRATSAATALVVESNPEPFAGAFHADGLPVTRERPARPGDKVTVWLNGAGALAAPVDEARSLESPAALAAPVGALVGRFSAEVESAGPVVGSLPSRVRVVVVIPEEATPGLTQLAIFTGEGGLALLDLWVGPAA